MRLSENAKIINIMSPATYGTGFDGVSKIIDISGYSNVALVIQTGASSTSDSVITVEALDGSTPSDTSAAIPFKYRYNDGDNTTDDDLGSYQSATADGFAMTPSKADSMYVIEVKDNDLLEAGQDGYNYLRLKATAVSNTIDDTIDVSVLAICYNGRYNGMDLDQITYSAT